MIVVRVQREEIENLIKRGAEVDAVDFRGQTPLMWAVIFGNFVGVKTLLKHKTDATMKAQDNEGKTVIEHVIERLEHSLHPEVH